jgi:hypothetical protein
MNAVCAFLVIVFLVVAFFASLVTIPVHGIYGLIIPGVIVYLMYILFKDDFLDDEKYDYYSLDSDKDDDLQ